ncbi:hypothetical protein HaLaN_19721, partial [Haematococcus lacustris]
VTAWVDKAQRCARGPSSPLSEFLPGDLSAFCQTVHIRSVNTNYEQHTLQPAQHTSLLEGANNIGAGVCDTNELLTSRLEVPVHVQAFEHVGHFVE